MDDLVACFMCKRRVKHLTFKPASPAGGLCDQCIKRRMEYEQMNNDPNGMSVPAPTVLDGLTARPPYVTKQELQDALQHLKVELEAERDPGFTKLQRMILKEELAILRDTITTSNARDTITAADELTRRINEAVKEVVTDIIRNTK